MKIRKHTHRPAFVNRNFVETKLFILLLNSHRERIKTISVVLHNGCEYVCDELKGFQEYRKFTQFYENNNIWLDS